MCARITAPVSESSALWRTEKAQTVPMKRKKKQSRDQVSDTVFPLPHLAPEETRVTFRISGMWCIQRGMCPVAGETCASCQDPCPHHHCWLVIIWNR